MGGKVEVSIFLSALFVLNVTNKLHCQNSFFADSIGSVPVYNHALL